MGSCQRGETGTPLQGEARGKARGNQIKRKRLEGKNRKLMTCKRHKGQFMRTVLDFEKVKQMESMREQAGERDAAL